MKKHVKGTSKPVLSNLVTIRNIQEIKMWLQRVVLKENFNIFLSKFDKSGNNKVFVATLVTNMATEIMWLDMTDLNDGKMTEKQLVQK
jgi:hypothetical protein